MGVVVEFFPIHDIVLICGFISVRNNLARDQNDYRTQATTLIIPLVNAVNGEAIPNFPKTIDELNALTGSRLLVSILP